jgi:hypothetical protein
MQNRKKIKVKRAQEESKNDVSQEGLKYHFQKGKQGINIVFGAKYRPLHLMTKLCTNS